ncbi:MAG: ParB/RepB/Spo0J family partition protein [Candidatus Gastranaerophilales bacterium]|nr:ParB/RepB/Spo0J family partition protein [Candidatus Gastranaerophilales bacterium]
MMAKKSGLGKGLGAILSDKYDSQAIELAENSQIVELRIVDVEPNKDQPRKEFDKEKLDELADSISKHGVIQPIIVAKKDDIYQIVAGERRWRASKQAGLKKIPAIIRNYDEIKIMEVALIENLQREDLNPVEEALGYKFLIEKFSLTQDKISERVGKSRSSIANSLRLLNLSQVVLDMLEKGEISVGHAKVILSITNKNEQNQVAKMVAEKKLSVRETEALIKNRGKSKKPVSKVSSEVKLAIKDMENNFSKYLGTKVKIKDINGKGKIEISYFSHDEFERISDLLKNV